MARGLKSRGLRWMGELNKMAATPAGSAVDAQARFGHSVKGLLTEKVTSCGTDVIALTKQVLKGSRSAEFLGQAARNMVMQEDAILHSEDSLRKMAIITTHLQYQQEAIQKNVEQSSNLCDQLSHLLK
ncbi:BLOC-1-related complex subunit 7 isoform X3 [Hemicordylus capensis]|uniref:BLOC-1-related complex subunit 7 isoform X3 n=1 Tax=Hemicordylus capensis TaxID=884348 RepID=UPI0023027975|nr:BLOC-1-related complex subunit 7 isoform X3 [Hemicordylus capensis]